MAPASPRKKIWHCRAHMIDHRGEVLAERDGLTVINCRACGFAHLKDLPNPETLDRFYRSAFWEAKGDALAHYLEQKEWTLATYGDWLALVEQNIMGRTLLDVGSGYGWMLDVAKTNAWTARGLEPSTDAFNYSAAQGHWVEQYSWQDMRAGGKYDCITALWLIEHLPDPKPFLLWCREHLYSGGALLLACPNDFTYKQEKAQPKVKNYFLDATHTCYFNWTSIANLLGRCGFKIVEQTCTYDMADFLLAGSDYTANPGLGRILHERIEQMDLGLNRSQRLLMYQHMARHGGGRDLVIVARPE